jgi:hypothetical protein
MRHLLGLTGLHKFTLKEGDLMDEALSILSNIS